MELLESSKVDGEEKDTSTIKKCGICGDSHFYRDCKYVIITTKVQDRLIPSRARLSLPDILEIKKLADETHSVFTKGVIEVGTEFGPFIAKKNLTLHPSAIFPIKLFIDNESDLSEYYLDTTDEAECCWMMFVTPASDVEEQNLICYQEGENIFYGAIRDIPPGEELKVWYSPYCAFKMQKNTLTFKDSSTLQVELDASRSDPVDLNAIITKQQNIISRALWNCKFCYKLEKNVTDFGKHLLTHYISHKKRTCQYCQKRFSYSKDCKKHLKLFHGESISKTNNQDKSTSQVPAKAIEQSDTNSEMELKKSTIGGPLLLQCLTDSLDNSNSLLQQPEVNLFDLDNYDNQNLLLDSDNLRLNVDVIGTSTLRDIDDFNPDVKIKDTEKKEFVCDICLKKFGSLKAISSHLSGHIGKYFCLSCKKVFARAESFKQHKCNQLYTLKCPKCERIFYQKKYLVKHISLFHDKKFACTACLKNCYSASELRNHYCKKAPKEKRVVHKCSTCPKSFKSQVGLRKHAKKHPNPANCAIKHICSECSETFSSKDCYQRHVNVVHNKSRRHDCRICDKVFLRKDVLNAHLRNFHRLGQNEVFKCPTCNKDFKCKKYLDSHQLVHNNSRTHICKICGSSFKYARNLLRHIKLGHKNSSQPEDVYVCPICYDKMKLKNSLQRHIRRKHPERYQNFCVEVNARRDEIKHVRYKCPICKHKVKLKRSLERHISVKHPEDYESLSSQLDEMLYVVDKKKKDDAFDNYMDLQKTIENMDFNIDTSNDNLLGGSEIIDKFLKESSDQISILFAASPRTVNNVNETSTTIFADRITNREVGLSMPDLLSEIDVDIKSEIDEDIKLSRNYSNTPSTLNIFDSQMDINNSSDVVCKKELVIPSDP